MHYFPHTRSFASYFLSILLLSTYLAVPAWSASDTASPAETKPTAAPVVEQEENTASQDLWDILLQNRMKELSDITVRAAALQKKLTESTREFSTALSKIEADYQRFSAMARVSRGLPVELTGVDDNLQRLYKRLLTLRGPFENELDELQNRLSEISLLEKGANTQAGKADTQAVAPELTDFQKKLDKTQQSLTQIQNRLKRVMLPAQNLAQRMEVQKADIAEHLPTLWRDYYLEGTGRLYDTSTWSSAQKLFDSVRENALVRIMAELPAGGVAWLNVVARLAFVFIPLLGVLFVLRRLSRKAPVALARGWDRMSRHSVPLLIAGFAMHFAAWVPASENYRVLSVCGTMLLCIGQMALAWDMYTFSQPEAPRKSQLGALALPLVCGLLLLLLNFPGPLLGVCWIAVLMLILWFERRARFNDSASPLVINLLRGHAFILWIAILMTMLGWARLSILLCMAYAALAVCIQQAVGFMRLTGGLTRFLPEKGVSALLGGVLLAMVVPAVLVLLTLTTGLWILAYPGGALLLKQAVLLNINIGQSSFNILQIFLIVSVFYVTRSVISVGRSFLYELPSRGVAIDQSLLGPIQVAYTYTLWAMFGLYTLNALGFSLTSLAMVAGGLSVGIGFGLQSIINNFVSGILLIFGRTLREGDIIEVGSLTATVKEINIRSTIVETPDNAIIFVPNSEMLSGQLTNWTRNGRMVRREVSVGVAYGTDVQKVLSLLQEIAENNPQVLRYPEPMVLFNDFGASSLDFMLRFWIGDIMHGLAVLTEVRVEIERRFRENNIEIAFPQLDVHMKQNEIIVASNTEKAEKSVEKKTAWISMAEMRGNGKSDPAKVE